MSYYLRLFPSSPSVLVGVENHTFTTQALAAETGNILLSDPSIQSVQVWKKSDAGLPSELVESLTKPVGAPYTEERMVDVAAGIQPKNKSDGSSAEYYLLPDGVTQLQALISHRDMNAQLGEIFRAAYRYGMASHSDKLRDAKKIKFYIEAEIERLEVLA